MNSEIRKLLESVQAGKTSVDDAMLELKKAPFEDIGYAKVDLHRKVRQGAAEVIYGAGKTPEQIGGIIDAMRANGQTRVLITRMSPEAAAYVGSTRELDYHKDARVGIVGGLPQPDGIGKVVIATGGTSDIPVAEEAALTAQVLGSEVVRLYDVGVSGVHRLLAHMDSIMEASVVVHRGHGGGACQRGGRSRGMPGDRRPHQCGLRRVLRRRGGAAEYAQFLRQRRVGGEHRQRLRRGVSGEHD